MKQLAYVLMICLLAFAGHARADAGAQVEAALDGFHAAAARADAQAYLAHLTPEAVFLGTDGTERWQGEDYRNFVESSFAGGSGWTYTSLERTIQISPDGRIAWFDEALSNEVLGNCRGSGVLVLSGDQWQIAQYNLSVPVPNTLMPAVVADIGAWQRGDAPVEAAATEAGAQQTEAAQEEEKEPGFGCRQRRHKTNKKGGC